jgi:hypothetical protein
MTPLLFFVLLDLHGRVLDSETSQPIAKAEITAPGQATVFSGPDGRFTIPNLQRGPNSVSIYARGYALSKMRAGKDPYTRRIFWLDESNHDKEFTAVLRKGARVEGRVVDEDRDPVPRGEMMLLERVKDAWEFAYVVALPADGRFEFFGIPEGRYAVGCKGYLQEIGALKPGESREALELRIPNAEGLRTEFLTHGFGNAVWSATVENVSSPGMPLELLPNVIARSRQEEIYGDLPRGDYLIRVFQKTQLGLRTLVEQNVIVREAGERFYLTPSNFSPLTVRAQGIPRFTRLRIQSLNPSNLTDLDLPVEDGENFVIPSLSPGRYKVTSQVPLEPDEFTMPASGHRLELRAQAPLISASVELQPGAEPILYRAGLATAPNKEAIEAPVRAGFGASFRLSPGTWELRLIP